MKTKVWERMSAFVRLGRPKFLLGGFALFGLGCLTATFMGFDFRLGPYLWGQLAVSSIQLMTHYSNDYFDLEADRANRTPTNWSGGSRVLVRGELPRSSALIAALVLVLVAIVSAVVLCTLDGMNRDLLLALFATMLLTAWSYSSPPLRLHSHGMGEFAVAFVVPFLTPLSGFVVQANRLSLLPMLLTLPLIGLQLVMLLTLQIPDVRGDREAGKRTWTVLFGVRPIVALCSVLTLLSFALALSSPLLGAPKSLWIVWGCLVPVAVVHLANYRRSSLDHPLSLNRLAFGSVALFFLAIAADLVGLVVAGSTT